MRVPLTTASVSPILRATNPVSFARGTTIEVVERGTDTQADVYSAEEAGEKLAQPLITDSAGRIEGPEGQECWIEGGAYDLLIEGVRLPWDSGIGHAELDAKFDGDILKVAALPSSVVTDSKARFVPAATGVAATDQASIQAALDGGGVVRLQPGQTYKLPLEADKNTNTLTIPSNTVFDFNGSTIECPTDEAGGTYRSIIGVGTKDVPAEHVTIANGVFDGLQSVDAEPEPAMAIYIHTGADDVRVDGIRFRNIRGDCVNSGELFASDARRISVTNCDAVQCVGQLATFGGCSDLAVEGCTLDDPQHVVPGAVEAVFFSDDCKRVRVVGNTFTGCGPIAIYGVTGYTVMGNTVVTAAVAQAGVTVALESFDGSIIGNHLDGSVGKTSCISLQFAGNSLTIAENTFVNEKSHGAIWDGGSAVSTNVAVLGNVFDGEAIEAGKGLGNILIAKATLARLSVVGNIFNRVGPVGRLEAEMVTFSSNQVREGCTTVQGSHCCISDNVVKGGESSVTGSAGRTFEVYSTGGVVANNQIISGLMLIEGKELRVTANNGGTITEGAGGSKNVYLLNSVAVGGLSASSRALTVLAEGVLSNTDSIIARFNTAQQVAIGYFGVGTQPELRFGNTNDANIWRRAAKQIKTGQMFIANEGLGVGNSAAAAGPVGAIKRKIQVFDGEGAALGFIPVYETIT